MSIIFPFHKASKHIRNSEEEDVIKSLREIRDSIDTVYNRLNHSSDELITDSLNYELLSLRSRHRFYIAKAKELSIKYGCRVKTEVQK